MKSPIQVNYALSYGKAEAQAWSKSGNQGKGWKKANFLLVSPQDFQVIKSYEQK